MHLGLDGAEHLEQLLRQKPFVQVSSDHRLCMALSYVRNPKSEDVDPAEISRTLGFACYLSLGS